MKLRLSRKIRASPEAVWEVLGDFGGASRWTSLLSGSYSLTPDEPVGVGTTRHCDLSKKQFGAQEILETITDYEEGKKLAFKIDGGFGYFKHAENIWTLESHPVGSIVRLQPVFQFRNRVFGFIITPLMKPMMKMFLRRGLKDLAQYVENAEKNATITDTKAPQIVAA